MKRSVPALVGALLVAFAIAVPVVLQEPLAPMEPVTGVVAQDAAQPSAVSSDDSDGPPDQSGAATAISNQTAAMPDEPAGSEAQRGSQDSEPEYGPEYEPGVVLAHIADGVSLEEVNAELSTLDFTTTRHIDEADVSYGYIELELARGVDVSTALARLDDVEFAVEFQPNYIYRICDEATADEAETASEAESVAESAEPAETAESSAEPAETAAGATASDVALQPAAGMALQSATAQEITAQSSTPNDPKLGSQWALTAINAFGAWDYARGNHKVTVAVLDSGLDMDHPDFADKNGVSNVIGGYSVLQANKNGDVGNYDDVNGHGTHVAGIIAAATDNGAGIAGVSYNANIMPVQVIDSKGSVSSSNAAKGVNYVVDYAAAHPEANIRVINLSFGTESPYEGLDNSDRALTSALTGAYNAGILVVCAAGNGGDDYSVADSGPYKCFPCDYASEAIGVINARKTESTAGPVYSRYSGSNYNMANQRTKELTAPGSTIHSTTNNGDYGNKTGTSMAAPYVSGVAALVFATSSDKSASEVKQVLVDTATDMNVSANIAGEGKFDLETGYGMVNAEAAVKASAAYLSDGDALMVGDTLQLSVENGSGLTWTWTSSNEDVATVGASGLVAGQAAGKATITAKLSNSVTLYREVSVYDPAMAGDSTVEYGALSQLTVPAANPTSSWVFESSDSDIVTIGRTTGRFVATGVGSATITVHLNGDEAISSTKTITVTKADLANATLGGVEDQPYTGSAVTLPDLTVVMPDYTRAPTYTSRQLVDGTGSSAGDYTVSYSPNVERGQVTVTVTAKGDSNYTGSTSATFRIVNGSVKNATFTGAGTYAYTGQPIVVTDLQITAESGEVLQEGVDYEVVYPDDHTNVGRVCITVNGINNYGGTAEAYFSITPISINDVDLSGIVAKTYTGSAITQAPILTYNAMTLRLNTDYSIAYLNNTNAGTATLYIQGLGNYATYSGIFPTYRTATFAISPASISDATVSFGSYTYTGSAQKPVPTVTFGGKTLSPDVDFTVEYPDDCTDAGEKQVTVKALAGSGKNFAGTKSDNTTKYTISKKAATITAGSKAKVYDGAALTATQAGYSTSGFVNESDVVGVSLSGSVTNVGKAASTVSSYELADSVANNYTVTKAAGTLQVTAADLSLADVTIEQESYSYDGSAKEPGVTVRLGNKLLTRDTDYTVGYSDNVNVGTAAVAVTGKGNYEGSVSKTFAIRATTCSVEYCTHVQNDGWQPYVRDGAMSGTSGQSLRLEAIQIALVDAPYSGSIEYCTHIQNIGWEGSWKSDGAMSGTSGQSLRLEAIQIRLTGEMANCFDVYYRVHCQNIGWMGWAKNGSPAGSQGYSYRLEAIEVKIVEKGGPAPGDTSAAFQNSAGALSGVPDSESLVLYRTHVQNDGWQNYMRDGEIAGTSGRSLRLEGINIKLGGGVPGGIEYRTHIQNIGWENGWMSNDAMSGTSGQSLRLEAIQIRLTGQAAIDYDVYYRVHAQNIGWMDWAKNGQQAGTAGYAYRLEAIQIELVPKGGSAPGSTDVPFLQL